jgi:hypothetical protein
MTVCPVSEIAAESGCHGDRQRRPDKRGGYPSGISTPAQKASATKPALFRAPLRRSIWVTCRSTVWPLTLIIPAISELLSPSATRHSTSTSAWVKCSDWQQHGLPTGRSTLSPTIALPWNPGRQSLIRPLLHAIVGESTHQV